MASVALMELKDNLQSLSENFVNTISIVCTSLNFKRGMQIATDHQVNQIDFHEGQRSF